MKKILLSIATLFVMSFASAQSTDNYIDDAPYNYEEVEVRPEFPGGNKAFMNFVSGNFKIPDYDGTGGTLKVDFIIEMDGAVTNVKVIKDLGGGTGSEAKRILNLSPRWSPGEHGGKKIRVLYHLPIKIAGQN